MKINSQRFLRTLVELSQFGAVPEGGVSRLCLAPEEVNAKKYVFNLMKEAGLKARFDQVANVIGILDNDSNSIVCAGSHVDSVMNGGRLDGNYGVLGAIEAVRTMKESNLKLKHSLMIVSFTNEEGIRFPPMTGSKFMVGEMTLEEIYTMRDSSGASFKDLIKASGLETSSSIQNTKSFNSFVELHIEQGPILEYEKKKIGLVQSIVGIMQFNVTIEGSSDHAGTTPMSMRKDALIASSLFILRIKDLANEVGGGAVGTVGKLDVLPGAPNVIPGKVNFTVDFRHSSADTLHSCKQKIESIADSISKETGMRISISPRAYLAPASMSTRIMDTIEKSIGDLNLSYKKMHSGAGHDTMTMRKITETGMIFVPSRGGKSHSALEATDPEDLVNGANVLLNTLVRLAT